MKGSHGYRRRTRSIKTKSKDKGKIRINRYLQEFNEGDVVSIAIDPTYQAIPHPRFRGKSGKIVGKQGRVYFVRITDGGKQKDVLVAPEHLVGV